MVKKYLRLIIIGLFLISGLTSTKTVNAIVADHTVIDQFSILSQSTIETAAAKKILFMHQSTGEGIRNPGLLCLAGLHGDSSSYPQECVDYANNRTSGSWPWYDNTNWNWPIWYQQYGGPQADAIAKTDQFVTTINALGANYDVIGMKYCYVDGWNQYRNVGYLDDIRGIYGYYISKMLDLETQFPNKTFIWTTSAIWRQPSGACNSIFNSCEEIYNFNQQVRAYTQQYNKPLYDIADIESHDVNGNPCLVQGYEGMCANWYSDGGGHLNTNGTIRLAKAFWWLIANLNTAPSPTPTPTPTPTPSLTPSATPTPNPSFPPTPAPTPAPTPTPTPTPAPTPTPTPTPAPTPSEVINPTNIATLEAGTNVLINFNNFTSPVDNRPIPTNYAGCTWNSLVEGSPWAGLTTWNFYILNGGARGTIVFPRPVIVKSLVISSSASNQITLSSSGNPNVNLTSSGNNPRTLTTGWTSLVTSVTISSSTSDQAFDDLRLTVM